MFNTHPPGKLKSDKLKTDKLKASKPAPARPARRQLLPLARSISLGLCYALSTPAMALPQDSQQPVEISADRTEFDSGKQQHTLSGRVQITQGSMRIDAEEITLRLKDGQITEVNGRGTPLRYRITDNDGQPLEASARQIIYRPVEAKLSLLGDATLNRPDRALSGERIDYNIGTARINAVGSKDKRVKIVIQPEKKKP